MTFMSIFRVVVLSLSLFFSIVVLGLAANYTQGSTVQLNIVYDFAILALLTGSLSILVLPIMLFVAATRKGAFTSKIIVELPCLFIFSVLWLVVGGLTATWSGLLYPFGCGGLLPGTASWCEQFSAIEGLSFVTWIMLLAYTATLLTYAIIAHNRGNQVWNVGVNETTFFDRQNEYSGKADLFGGEPIATNHYQLNTSQRNTAAMPPNSATLNPSTRGTPVGDGSNSHSGYPQV